MYVLKFLKRYFSSWESMETLLIRILVSTGDQYWYLFKHEVTKCSLLKIYLTMVVYEKELIF